MKKEQKLIKKIFESLELNSDILSVTIVGSVENMNLENISDIDIVVVLNELSIKKFKNVKESIKKINLQSIGIEKELIINDTFGPLKFDTKNNLIFHLMIYDQLLHLEHVINSPFTCYDWERSDQYIMNKLSYISSVHKLMLNDFINSRRGTKEYFDDISKNQISYRKYVEVDNKLIEEKRYFDIDKKHISEFSYHIIFNSIGNLLKLFLNKNEKYDFENFMRNWEETFDKLYKKYNIQFRSLYESKINKKIISFDTLELTKKFLIDFDKLLDDTYRDANKLVLVRHFETELNDGRFLGSENDIGILSKLTINKDLKNFDFNSYDIFSSPSKRSLQTMDKLKIISYQISDELKEINYGDSEGQFFTDVIKENVYISESINKGIDFKFPNGEDNSTVLKRVYKLISGLKKNSIFFTHQGVIRCLIGNSLEIPINKWYLIKVPHGHPIEFINVNNNFTLNIDRETFGEIMENFNAKL